ncbi:hypothetical protein [Alienimonas chondri]|uniref:Uncharacterized protein n=1 Tax=Alienimonas chondri TaxID=2681879 RepID=A0ABX1V8W6_9PLAN|nr:hypothetical protein [Alienimonas chondri]NNJ24401.1 hypothetical protein [Alienimonas chondri]
MKKRYGVLAFLALVSAGFFLWSLAWLRGGRLEDELSLSVQVQAYAGLAVMAAAPFLAGLLVFVFNRRAAGRQGEVGILPVESDDDQRSRVER